MCEYLYMLTIKLYCVSEKEHVALQQVTDTLTIIGHATLASMDIISAFIAIPVLIGV